MDAVRIIAASRCGLAKARTVHEVVVEAWQAQALAEAVGSHLATAGPHEVRSRAEGLGDAGGRSGGTPVFPVSRAGGLRAAQLSEVRDTKATLTSLSGLLGEVCEALVGVVCAADEEGMYWTCVEAMDAADESRDRVSAILKQLAVRDRDPA
ncbi:DUF6099 family protein [Streptomyces sp. MST-110588]|uniref:DUF6099 family protein n=1 Tax=Streptomyces sp. MST-110588 TaxID=2833628 RepID=UPI001F5E1361|nr:DUF6099 family protein [Streptomyces sp. MST-110588]UNO39498.1 hypothetical protein KGS77_07650 [Streptomyces sp. MST-110588]